MQKDNVIQLIEALDSAGFEIVQIKYFLENKFPNISLRPVKKTKNIPFVNFSRFLVLFFRSFCPSCSV